MQQKVFTKRLLLLCFIALSALYAAAQTKRALIVAIGNYPANSGWETINSVNDLPLLKNALLKQNFLPANIRELVDSAATKKGIENALLQLVDAARPGDVVVIHFSSHGEQIEDDNINEEADGLDETIVPFDAKYADDPKLSNKLMAGYFRDDAFGEIITRLRNKLGSKGDILVSIDACHSGTGTRGGGPKVRGNKAPMVSPNFNRKRMSYKDTAGVFKENTRTRLNADAANYVVISGSQAEENNSECYDDEMNPAGSLSYALSKTLTSLDGKISYRTLFARVEDIIRDKAPKQKPVIEGDNIDRELFGGKYIPQSPYFTVNMNASNQDSVLINAGTLAGVTTGSEISFYPGGTNTISGLVPLRKGKVVIATNFTATVKLDSTDPGLLKKIPWAFLTQASYGNQKIKLGLDSLTNGLAQRVKELLHDYANVEYGSGGDLYFGRATTGNGWALRYASSGEVFADSILIDKKDQVKEFLKMFDRYRYLKGLKISEQDLSAKVELVLLDAAGNPDAKKLKERTNFGRLELKEGDVVYLKVVNTGKKNFYVNVLDMQPDGIINAIVPNSKLRDRNNNPAPITMQDCLVKVNDSLFRKDYAITIYRPFGEEIFKVFLSTNQLDLESILVTNDDSKSRGGEVLNNLAKIFKESATDGLGKRGGSGTINTANDGTIFSFNFSIKPK